VSAGYSGTPLVRKLGIKEGARLALIREPPDFAATLGTLPPAVQIRRRARAPLDVAVAFFTRRVELERRLPALQSALDPAGGLWIAWPKRASGVETDLTENVVRELGLAAGLVDNKVCAIDQVWSALRLVYRVRDRPGAGG
jgi:alkylation response protein AidB-like acyl-CoA dehydrogenase